MIDKVVELIAKTTWKSLTAITDTTEHDLPTANEYLLVAEYGVFKLLAPLPADTISSSYSYYEMTGNSAVYGAVRIKTNKIIFDNLMYNETNQVGSGASLTVYYR